MESKDEKEKFCPNCKRDVAAANFDLHFTHCSRNLVLCRRCNEPVPIGDMNHFKERHSVVACLACGDDMERWELDGPHKEFCRKRPEICKYCEMELPFDSLQDHESYCGARTDQCPVCKKFVMIKEKEDHMKEKCPKRLVSCSSCQLEYPFDKHREHLQFCLFNSERGQQKTEVGKTKGSRPKKSYTQDVTSRHGAAAPDDDEHEEQEVSYKCPICDTVIPSNKFKAHYESCFDSQQEFDQFPRHNKTVNKGHEHVLQSCMKRKEPSNDSASSDDSNEAPKLKSNNDHFQVTKIDEFLCENPNSTGKKRDVATMLCRFCGSHYTGRELKEHLKQCSRENNILWCACGKDVRSDEMSDHKKRCAARVKICKLCRKECADREFENHLESCPMSVVTCESCGKDFLRHELESHSCTREIGKNGIKTKTRRPKQTDILTDVNRRENNESEGDKKAEYCKFCERQFPVNMFTEHVKSCFMRPVVCQRCREIFPVDEFQNHPCTTRNEGQKLYSLVDTPLLNSSRDRKLEGHTEYQQNNKAVQNSSLSVEHKQCITGSTEYLRYPENLNFSAVDNKLYSHASSLTQMSDHFSLQKSSDSGKSQTAFCKFCSVQVDAEDWEEHLIQCNARCVACTTCGASVKLKELENHSKLCSKKGNCCQFCKKSYPPSEHTRHSLSCPESYDTCELCEKDFPRGELEGHLCPARAVRQNRKQISSHHSKCHKNRKCKGTLKHPDHCKQDARTNENCDQRMEVGGDNVDPRSEAGRNQGESSKTREMSSDSSSDEYVPAAEDVQHNKDFFECKICDRRKPMEDLSLSLFKENESSVCLNCVRNLQQLNLEFAGNTYFNASSPPNEDNSSNADAVKKKNKTEMDVKPCEFCEENLPVDFLKEHLEMCGNRPYECPRCKNLVLQGEKETHDHICNGVMLEESYHGNEAGNPVNSARENKGTNSSQAEKVHCRYCQEIPHLSLEWHEKHCGFRFTSCEKCKQVVQLRYLKNPCWNNHGQKQESVSFPGFAHRLTPTREEEDNSKNERAQASCGTSQTACSDCKKPLSYAEIENHQNTCEMHLGPCLFCDAPVLRRNKARHIQNSCPGYKVGAGIPDEQLRKGPKQSSLFDKILEAPGKLLNRKQHNSSQKCNNCKQSSRRQGRSQQFDNPPLVADNQEEAVKIPCEFCDGMFNVDELIVHQSGCRPEIFAGSAENDAGEEVAPENRRYIDNNSGNNVPGNSGRGLFESFQGRANLRQNDQDHESRNKSNIFSNHPRDSDVELNDVRLVHKNQRCTDSDAGNRTKGVRNMSNDNISRTGPEPGNKCIKCQMENRHDCVPSQEDEHQSHFSSVEKSAPAGEINDALAFSYVGKADTGNVNSRSIDKPPDSEQIAENIHNYSRPVNECSGVHSNNRGYSVNYKITYSGKKFNTSVEDDSSEMCTRPPIGPSSHYETKQNKGQYVRPPIGPSSRYETRNEERSQFKKYSESDKANISELTDYKNENSVSSGQDPVAEGSDRSYPKHHEKYWLSRNECMQELIQGVSELSLDQHGSKYSSSNNSKHRSENEMESFSGDWQNITPKHQVLQDRSTDNSGRVSDRGSYASSSRQSNRNQSHSMPKSSDEVQEKSTPYQSDNRSLKCNEPGRRPEMPRNYNVKGKTHANKANNVEVPQNSGRRTDNRNSPWKY